MNLNFDISGVDTSSMFAILPHFYLFIGVTVDVKHDPEYFWRFFIKSFKFGFFMLLEIFLSLDLIMSGSFGFKGDMQQL
jgi:hypothetical protein